jgi:hypothetical protein
MSDPASNNPKLKYGAALLWTACPKSLRALFDQLNHGTEAIEIPMKM